MVEFIEKHWDLINWPTALIGVTILTPIALLLFNLIARNSKEQLRMETDAHRQTRREKDDLAAELATLRDENDSLVNRLKIDQNREVSSDIELSDEERIVLVAISSNKMNELYRSKKLSDQRISLAQDRLVKAHLVGWGVEGCYAKSEGREWLNAHGLLK